MKTTGHPQYVKCTVVCGCGVTFETRSTVSRIAVDICSSCHPFYTGLQKFVDTAGRIETFRKKYEKFSKAGAAAAKT